jgi:hypothetical protein
VLIAHSAAPCSLSHARPKAKSRTVLNATTRVRLLLLQIGRAERCTGCRVPGCECLAQVGAVTTQPPHKTQIGLVSPAVRPMS